MLDDVVGEVAELEAHVFKVLHVGVEVEILDVDCHDFFSGGQEDSV